MFLLINLKVYHERYAVIMVTMLYSSHSFVATIKMTVANNDDNHLPVRRSWPRRDDLTNGGETQQGSTKDWDRTLFNLLSRHCLHLSNTAWPTRFTCVATAVFFQRLQWISLYNMSQRLCWIFNPNCKTQMESLHFILGGIYDRIVIRGSLNRGSMNQEIDGSPLDWLMK